MTPALQIPTAASEIVAYDAQVAGHVGSLSQSVSGDLLFKPTNQTEVDFYESVAESILQGFLGRWTPRYYGVLQLHGRLSSDVKELDPSKQIPIEPLPAKEAEKEAKQSLVLENVAHRFVRPNIIDIKLGTILYDAQSSPEKKERMEKAAIETTTRETGLRLTGFKIWDSAKGEYQVTDKMYGKALKAAELPQGFARAFPASSAQDSPGLPQFLLADVLRLIVERTEQYYETVKHLEWRLVASSILIVYEGDSEALKTALSLPQEDSDDEEDDEDEDEEEAEEQEEREKSKKAFTVKVIDFAHTTKEEGRGSDEGYNLGVRNVIKLLKGRLSELKALKEA